jgi:hypothetical protein
MAPALFVEFGFEALRRPRFIVARIAPWTRRSRAAAGAGVLALERSIRMGLADPSAILTNGALHGACYLAGFLSLGQPYYPAPLYSIERENDLVPIEHS